MTGPPGSNNFSLPSTTPFSSSNSGPASSTAGGGASAGGVGPTTNSPLPPPATSEMNSSSGGVGIPNISSPLPSVDSKKDVKLLSPSSSGYQGSSTLTADASLQGSGLPSLPSVNIKEEPMSTSTTAAASVPASGGGPSHMANSPHPPPSVEMNNPVGSIPSVRSLPSVESKKDIFQNKVATPPSSGFQDQTPSSQSVDPMLTGGPVPSVPEQKPPSSVSNQKIQPDPSLRKGKSQHPTLMADFCNAHHVLFMKSPTPL